MSGSGLDSLHEVISRLEQLTGGHDIGTATTVDLKMAEEYLSKLLQLEKSSQLLMENYYVQNAPPSNITNSNRRGSDPHMECKHCGDEFQARCHDCNEYLCARCARRHEEEVQQQLTKHLVEYFPPPIGSPRSNISPASGSPPSNQSPPSYSQILRNSDPFGSVDNFGEANNHPLVTSPQDGAGGQLLVNVQENYCFLHTNYCKFVCITKNCRKHICTKCLLSDHRGHIYMSTTKFASSCAERIKNTIKYSDTGVQKIKDKIDEVLRIQYRFERDCIELRQTIEHVMQQLGVIDGVADLHQEKIQHHRREKNGILQDQMVHLKAILAAFTEICSKLENLIVHPQNLDGSFVATNYFNYECRLEQLGENYRCVQPKNWCIFFSPPIPGVDDFGTIFCGEVGDVNWTEVRAKQHESLNLYLWRRQNAIDAAKNLALFNGYANRLSLSNGVNNFQSSPVSSLLTTPSRPLFDFPTSMYAPVTSSVPLAQPSSTLPLPSQLNSHAIQQSEANSINSIQTQQSSNQNHMPPSRFVQSRRNSHAENKKEHPPEDVYNFPLGTLLASFGSEGKALGEICRPWGICTDIDHNIVISDRRNHRIQVFTPDGAFLYSFGREGDGDGEFQLPAGVCVDLANRIIVVDKDNHRVQIFSVFGRFILKFGKLGKDRGQFQYPWGVAVNSKQQIVVTDSRNHRVQQFDAEGRFVRSISFEFGITKPSPRGISYNSDGLLLVSDFDNHCLYLVDLDHRTILRTVGGEGFTLQHFNRPSGISVNKDGLIAVADSKNQRILILNRKLKVVWTTRISQAVYPRNIGNRDRVSDIAFLSNDILAFISELSPDEKQLLDSKRTFIHIIKLPQIKPN